MQDYEMLLDKFRRLCSRREYCSEDILTKIKDENASKILEQLIKDGFVDDGRYAKAFANDKYKFGGWGKNKIRYALKIKKIDEGEIEAALEQIEKHHVDDRLSSLISSKSKILGNSPNKRQKLIRFALSKGYSYDEIMSNPLIGQIKDRGYCTRENE